MPLDPSLPADGTPISAAEMRAQFAAIKDTLDTHTSALQSHTDQLAEIHSSDLSHIQTEHLSFTVTAPPTQEEVQAIYDKLDELLGV